MVTGNDHVSQALFRSISDNGTEWIFVARPNGTWAITRNGTKCDAGSSNRASLTAGVERFLSLAATSVDPVRMSRDTVPVLRSA